MVEICGVKCEISENGAGLPVVEAIVEAEGYRAEVKEGLGSYAVWVHGEGKAPVPMRVSWIQPSIEEIVGAILDYIDEENGEYFPL